VRFPLTAYPLARRTHSSLRTSSFTPMSSIYAHHLTDPSATLGPFGTIAEATQAVRDSGGYVTSTRVNDVTYSDFPRKSFVTPTLNVPPLNLTLFLDRLPRG
jgi:hypothetical protein